MPDLPVDPKAILKHIQDGLLIIDKQGFILWTNDAFRHMLVGLGIVVPMLIEVINTLRGLRHPRATPHSVLHYVTPVMIRTGVRGRKRRPAEQDRDRVEGP